MSTAIDCLKYSQSNEAAEECAVPEVSSYNLRSGRERASASGAEEALALTANGWIAWVAAPSHALLAIGAHGKHTLDAGPVEPRSLGVSGQTVHWTSNGVAHSAVLS